MTEYCFDCGFEHAAGQHDGTDGQTVGKGGVVGVSASHTTSPASSPEATQQGDGLIKHCPFCGSYATLIDAPEAGNEGAVVVECNGCRASGPVVFGIKADPKPRAIDLWNKRATQQAGQTAPSEPLSSYAFANYGSDAKLYNGIHDLETKLEEKTDARNFYLQRAEEVKEIARALVAALESFIAWHGAAHIGDCPEDDTCDCEGGELNRIVKAALSRAKDAGIV